MNKQEVFNINGMMRDLGNSKSSPKYAYDIMNMRLFNFEENTAGNLCNDYGNHSIPVVNTEGTLLDVLGQTVGVCKISNDTIIIFTAGVSTSYIYKGVLKPDNSALECTLLYLGTLNFDTNHPIESLYNYENEKSLKIYWTDGKNPLRQLNLAADSATMSSWAPSSFLFNPYLQLNEEITVNRIAGGGKFHAGTVQYAFTYYNLYGPESAVFYNTPLYYAAPDDRGGAADEIINCSFNINIKKFDKNFDFLRVYAILRTSINGTPAARKVSDIVIPKSDYTQPEYTLSKPTVTDYNSFFASSIKLFKLNGEVIHNGSQYIRDNALIVGDLLDESYQTKISGNDFSKILIGDALYSVPPLSLYLIFYWKKFAHRTVTMASSKFPLKYTLLSDEESLNIIDDGIIGESVDYTSLLYKGGEEITAQTLDSKDNTLFLGNISLKKPSLLNLNVGDMPLSDYVKNLSVEFNYNGNKTLPSPTKNSFYPYINLLRYNSELIKHFKQGSVYRLGFLAQYQDGSWSTVVYVKDIKNDKPIKTTFYEDGEFQFPTPEVILTPQLIETLLNAGYKRIRPVVAFSNLPQWSFLGILNPTMYKIDSRYLNTLFSLASWSYRPNAPYDYNRTNKTSLADIPIVDLFDLDRAMSGGNSLSNYGIKELIELVASGNSAAKNLINYNNSRFFTLNAQHHELLWEHIKNNLELSNKRWAENGADAEFRHGKALSKNSRKKSEIQALPDYAALDKDLAYILPNNMSLDDYLQNYGNNYIIDLSIFNIDSPDILFNDLLGRNILNSKFRIVGAVPITTNYGQYDVQINGTTTPYTWPDTNGAEVKLNKLYGLLELDLLLDDPAHVEGPFTKDEVNYRFPDGNVSIPLGINTFSSQAWKTITSAPIWQDGLLYATLLRFNNSLDNDIYADVGTHSEACIFGNWWVGEGALIVSPNLDAYFVLYPWHRNVLNNSKTSLKTKILSNLKNSFKSVYLNTFYTDIKINTPSLFMGDLDLIKINDNTGSQVLYGGNVDLVLTTTKVDDSNHGYKLMLLNGANQSDDSTRWTRGKMSKTDFLKEYSNKSYEAIETAQREVTSKDASPLVVNYRDRDWYLVVVTERYLYLRQLHKNISAKDPISIKYKSQKHIVVSSKSEVIAGANSVKILPTIKDSKYFQLYDSNGVRITSPELRQWDVNKITDVSGEFVTNYPFWSKESLKYTQDVIDAAELYGPESSSKSILFGWLWLGELYNDIVAFPESSEESLELYVWHPCASPIKLVLNTTIPMYYYEGDTYYQRYDSLKTYPYTNEDPNLVIDVVSFMCETTKNIDGRYDKNRNTTFTSTISPTNFNLINEVYSQPNNFFQQRYISKAQSAIDKFENAVTWSLTKTSGEEIDSWTKLNLASVLDLDGDRGPVNKIKKFNNDLIVFQDSAIANILYNSNVQIASTTGVPIEISNSYKVDGKRYLSTNIGCKNKWSITETPSGLYFIDDLNKKLYLFQQGLKGISEEKGFNSWFHEQCNNNIWTPKDSLNFVTYFDNYYRELLLINKDNCLAFSEVANEFTSFYSYEKTPYFTNLNKERLFIKYGIKINPISHRTYSISNFYLGNTVPDSSGTNKYFSEERPVYITLKVQSNPLIDKVFNGLEYRNEFYTADGEDNFITDEHMFDNLNIWTDYQSGTLDINKVIGIPSSLKLKFRINRVLLPRDTSNADLIRRRDRIRNPWAFILLKANTNKAKFRIHDIVVNYTE